jgi:methylglutaconyl-CoA hydratase
MNSYDTIKVELNGTIGTIYLNRPEIHNAFNHKMVLEIIAALSSLSNDHNLRILLIRGNGKSFCSGADLNWMRDVVEFDHEKNYNESLLLANCLHTIYHFPVPVISFGHGSVIGGGNGFLATADFAVCTKNTNFAINEVTIGLVPAVISYFIIRRTGINKAKELMLSGQRFNGTEAEKWGLVNYAIDETDADDFIKSLIRKLIKNSPQALRSTKNLLNKSDLFHGENEFLKESAEIISKARNSKDGQEGMRSFLEKRPPVWE